MDYEAIEKEFARAIQAALEELGEKSCCLSWFCADLEE